MMCIFRRVVVVVVFDCGVVRGSVDTLKESLSLGTSTQRSTSNVDQIDNERKEGMKKERQKERQKERKKER